MPVARRIPNTEEDDFDFSHEVKLIEKKFKDGQDFLVDDLAQELVSDLMIVGSAWLKCIKKKKRHPDKYELGTLVSIVKSLRDIISGHSTPGFEDNEVSEEATQQT